MPTSRRPEMPPTTTSETGSGVRSRVGGVDDGRVVTGSASLARLSSYQHIGQSLVPTSRWQRRTLYVRTRLENTKQTKPFTSLLYMSTCSIPTDTTTVFGCH